MPMLDVQKLYCTPMFTLEFIIVLFFLVGCVQESSRQSRRPLYMNKTVLKQKASSKINLAIILINMDLKRIQNIYIRRAEKGERT